MKKNILLFEFLFSICVSGLKHWTTRSGLKWKDDTKQAGWKKRALEEEEEGAQKEEGTEVEESLK